MIIFITGLHIALCFFLILVVLLQTGKGADMGAAFGGSSQTVFGATGAVSLLGKVTTVTAALYMLTSLTLAWDSAREQSGGGGLDIDQFDQEREAAEQEAAEEAAGEEATGAEEAGSDGTPDAGIGDYKDAYGEDPAAEAGDGAPAGGDAANGEDAPQGGGDPAAGEAGSE